MTNHIAKYENYWTNDIGMDELTDEKNERTGRRTIYTDTIVRGHTIINITMFSTNQSHL